MKPTAETSATPLLYIASKQQQDYLDLLQQSSLKHIAITQDKSQANIVLADPPLLAKYLDELTNLKWAQATYAGIDKLTKPELRQDYTLTNVKGIFGQLISEYVLGYSLSYFRHLNQYQQLQAQNKWQPIEYQSVMGKKAVILGTGSIGTQLASCVSALGFVAIGVNSRGLIPQGSMFSQCYSTEQLDEALAQADVVVNALPSTPQTYHILNAQHLSHCQSALLFNIGRGTAVDDDGLLLALEKGWIAHAYLDVFPQEPLPQESAYWQHPNVSITPHIAANSFPQQVFDIFEQNMQRWQNQQPLLNQVDFSRGY
ncbi:D-2-hydroxyacid dehydrogenase [Vibrio algivorus]|uniref:2-ketoacid reductase n=1 Tax=Vibrio algivorus TaxID=1667024 RepID=A0ABQ6EJ49_9VIBR|nr:D-2-hydroxyacid dehydrogenase [Vibrio algivorus]GLT13044.1 2-ketoacid reductase [Vibrio algivorus]